MEFLSQFVEFCLHLDRHLTELTQDYGTWTYAILFVVVFCETGLVVTPFLPGDSLLFAAGSVAALGGLRIEVLCIVLVIAAVVGDAVNFHIGRWIGPRAFTGKLRFLKPQHLERTREFYARRGAFTIVLARFVPIIRTFAPFVAGIGRMNYAQFVFYNVFGAVLWVGSIAFAGYLFGHLPIVKGNFSLVVLGIIVVSLIPLVVEYFRARAKRPPDPARVDK
ncbi:MAG: DedA family protein [Planctomycetes bacterium]|nr:DedA family protein [Planctomycetota bacterium]